MAILTPLLFFCSLLHPIHASVSEIKLNEKSRSLEITSRIFIDDLELGIRERTNEPELDIMAPGKGRTTDQVVSNYLKDHFKIRLEGKPVTIKLLGHETEEVTLVCYIEVENVKKIKTLEITNDVITEIHGDQSNIVNVEIGPDIKSVRLTRDNPTETIKIKTK